MLFRSLVRMSLRRSRLAFPIVTLLACAVPCAVLAGTDDSTRVESAPAPLLTPPRPSATPSPSPAPEDTAVINGRRRAREDFGRGLMLEEQRAFAAAIVSYNNAARRDPDHPGRTSGPPCFPSRTLARTSRRSYFGGKGSRARARRIPLVAAKTAHAWQCLQKDLAESHWLSYNLQTNDDSLSVVASTSFPIPHATDAL